MTMKTKNPAAVALGSLKSEAKAAASRENGKRGGRPVAFHAYKIQAGNSAVVTMAPNRHAAKGNAIKAGLVAPFRVLRLGPSGALSLTGQGDEAGRLMR